MDNKVDSCIGFVMFPDSSKLILVPVNPSHEGSCEPFVPFQDGLANCPPVGRVSNGPFSAIVQSSYPLPLLLRFVFPCNRI